MPFATIDGADVAYEVDGSGPALVLLAGTGGDGRATWGPFVERFARDWTVIRPDYSGAGATRDDDRPLTGDFLAAQIVAVADAAGAERFDLLGFSLGAALAAKIAGDHPDRIRALVLLAGFQSAADARMQLQFDVWSELIATNRPAMARLILLSGLGPDALAALGADGIAVAAQRILEDIDWDGMARQIELDRVLDVRDSVRRITAPTLSIGCLHDHMAPPSHARGLAEAIPSARYVEMPTGHIAPLEAPGALADLVTAFLRAEQD